MNTYPNYLDIVSVALGDVTKLQGYLDNVMASKYNVLQIDGFTMAPDMQIDFTYEQIQKELSMNVMASYVDLDSDPVPIGTQGFTLFTGKIPRMKMRMEMDEDDARKQRIIQERFGAGSDRAANAAKNALFNTMDTLIGGHTNSLTYQRHQMVSKGAFTLNAENNPNGIKGITFGANVPDSNKTTLTSTARWWTSGYSTEGTIADPIKDLKALVEQAENKGLYNFHFEVEKNFIKKVLGHSKIISAIAVNQFPLATDAVAAASAASNLGWERRLVILGEIVGAPFKVIDSMVAVETYDKVSKKLKHTQQAAFSADVIVLVPDGNLGEILTVEPIKLPLTNGTYGEFYGGRLLTTVDYDVMKKIQYYQTEMTSLVVPSVPQYMFYLFTR